MNVSEAGFPACVIVRLSVVASASVAVAVIGTAKGNEARSVELQPAAAGVFQRLQAQAEIGDAIAERVVAWPEPPVDDRGVDDGVGAGVHGISVAIRAAAGNGKGSSEGRSATTRGGSPMRRCSPG